MITHIRFMDDRIRGKRILVVDDESDLTLFYRMSLEFHGFEVETFNDPRNALSNFQTILNSAELHLFTRCISKYLWN
jgi:PleD family two-component response regulator